MKFVLDLLCATVWENITDHDGGKLLEAIHGLCVIWGVCTYTNEHVCVHVCSTQVRVWASVCMHILVCTYIIVFVFQT